MNSFVRLSSIRPAARISYRVGIDLSVVNRDISFHVRYECRYISASEFQFASPAPTLDFSKVTDNGAHYKGSFLDRERKLEKSPVEKMLEVFG